MTFTESLTGLCKDLSDIPHFVRLFYRAGKTDQV